MFTIYFQTETGIQCEELNDKNHHLLKQSLWIDLFCPDDTEEKVLEEHLNLNIPTKNEMEEIELSSRLHIEKNALFMTATVVALSDSPEVKTDAVTFILTDNILITVRYTDLRAFHQFSKKLLHSKQKEYNALSLLLELLDAASNRLADILEKISRKFDDISQLIFHPNDNGSTKQTNYQQILQSLGSNGDLGTKTNESLVSLIRMISFLEQTRSDDLSKEMKLFLTIIEKDIDALRDYTHFLSTKFTFLLDATLGMINIEQNNIIKIFSVAAVIFLPPTLIASIYGMNFNYIPELQTRFGYPFAIVLMCISAWLPFRYFKKKKWL